jgi:hypothetical protein
MQLARSRLLRLAFRRPNQGLTDVGTLAEPSYFSRGSTGDAGQFVRNRAVTGFSMATALN